MIPPSLKNHLETILSKGQETSTTITGVQSVSGGSINSAYQLRTDSGSFFLKTNRASAFPGMFEAEAKGLGLLRSAQTIYIPEVLDTGEEDNTSYLLMEWAQGKPPPTNFWEDFGQALAQLHRQTQNSFGLDHDNYIGSLPQSNAEHASWSEFFIVERLEAQLKMAFDRGEAGTTTRRAFEHLYTKLDSFFPSEPPSLIHGDLWSGNYISGPEGQPGIIDPAVYFGHREMDLGMTRLFGGFQPKFYAAYQREWPLERDWEARLEVANLYPLLVHVNLFGGGYLSQVESILRRFS